MDNIEPGWLERQFDNVEKTVAEWSPQKRFAAGIPTEEDMEIIDPEYPNWELNENTKVSFNDITEVKAFSAYGRLFKTLYGAQRHIAKIQLLQEIEIECRDSRVKGEWYDPAQGQKDLFLKKYPPQDPDRREGYSSFAQAVTKRVKELRENR